MSSTFTLGIIGGGITLAVLFEMLRRQRLREKYAVIWVVVVAATLTLVIFPGLLSWAADLLGVQVPANLLFFGALMLLLVISIQLSYEIGRLEERTRTLAEEVALLRLQQGRDATASRTIDAGSAPTTLGAHSVEPALPPELGVVELRLADSTPGEAPNGRTTDRR